MNHPGLALSAECCSASTKWTDVTDTGNVDSCYDEACFSL